MTWEMLMAQRSLPMAHSLIPATARVHKNDVITRTIAEFADTGVDAVAPWEVFR